MRFFFFFFGLAKMKNEKEWLKFNTSMSERIDRSLAVCLCGSVCVYVCVSMSIVHFINCNGQIAEETMNSVFCRTGRSSLLHASVHYQAGNYRISAQTNIFLGIKAPNTVCAYYHFHF